MLIVASNMHIVTSNMRNIQEQLRDPHALWRAQARQREIVATRPARLKTARPLRQPSDGGGGGGGDGGGGGNAIKQSPHRTPCSPPRNPVL